MKRMIAVLGFVAAGAFAQTNPFFNPSSLPFQAPPFDQIKDGTELRMCLDVLENDLIEVGYGPRDPIQDSGLDLE